MHNCQDPGNAHFTHLEDVHFTYRKITWTHEVSGTSGSDDWRSMPWCWPMTGSAARNWWDTWWRTRRRMPSVCGSRCGSR